MAKKLDREQMRKIALTAILTAIVFLLQMIGSFIRIGQFSVSLVLVPIVLGASLCGVWSGTWLGLVFGVAVLASGDAASFLAIDPLGTVITVLVKGALAGLVSGLVYRALAKRSVSDGVLAASFVCPLVNTGIFLLGSRLFFWDTIKEWAGSDSVIAYILIGLVGFNFVFELVLNLVLSPTVVRLIGLKKSQ